jgi:hypothetical protein
VQVAGAVVAFKSPGHGSRVRLVEGVVKVIRHSAMVEENTVGWDEYKGPALRKPRRDGAPSGVVVAPAKGRATRPL